MGLKRETSTVAERQSQYRNLTAFSFSPPYNNIQLLRIHVGVYVFYLQKRFIQSLDEVDYLKQKLYYTEQSTHKKKTKIFFAIGFLKKYKKKKHIQHQEVFTVQ